MSNRRGFIEVSFLLHKTSKNIKKHKKYVKCNVLCNGYGDKIALALQIRHNKNRKQNIETLFVNSITSLL